MPQTPLQPLSAATQQLIASMASTSKIAKYAWKDRGVAPRGYITGMGIAWSTVLRKWMMGNSAALEMAQPNSHDADVDALSWYAGIFDEHGMNNELFGVDTLRHLFVLLMGLGMRESSGKHCCGRDKSADNTDAMTCEAGLFQMSWNASSSSPEMQKLYEEYAPGSSSLICAASYFSENVSCSSADWQCYGSGPGRDYQRLAKACPQFAVETTLIGLRKRRRHWGPINKYAAEVRDEANDLFVSIQRLIFDEEDVPQA